MVKLNNKGFAISGILYAILILFVVLLLGTLSVLASNKFLLDKTKNELLNSLNNEEPLNLILEYDEISYPLNYSGEIDFLDGVTAYDNNGNELKAGLIGYDTNLNLNEYGTYMIKYTATKGNLTAEAIRIIKVVYTNPSINGANPELSKGMIPIVRNGTEWVKADIFSNWYDYNTRKWANVVLVTDETRDYYQELEPGNPIKEDDVLAYLVWIPRYKYKLFNTDSLASSIQAIDIVFENKETPKSDGRVGEDIQTEQPQNGNYMTHPAFTFGDSELNGFWVGKFETTGTQTNPTVKPNSISLTNQNIKDQFLTSRLFNDKLVYGLELDEDAHMMKNTEWGAVAYLSQSYYGKYGNPIYTGALGLEKEIYFNNVNTYITTGNGPGVTGCAGDSINATMVRKEACPEGYEYYTIQGVKASTTGNIYGIYDMNGGVREYVMGAMYNDDDTTVSIGNSGFFKDNIDSLAMSKYIDKYKYGTTYNDQTAYNRSILGDAIGETRGWNGDFQGFVYNGHPWFARGGHYGITSSAGIFYFYRGDNAGDVSPIDGFRLVVKVR
ncbi:MAG: hypothetical protein PHD10_03565 [Bacilli bacterium]|nr:hypothetical protein [Bacilli bacterium]